ncbi:MAG: CmcJ/NvfI family oxidoreductase [Alphaproteobacteria bacterium]
MRTSLTFGLPQDGPASYPSVGLTGGVTIDNYETEDQLVTVHDMRPLAGALSLDRQGFELHGHLSKVDDLYSDAAIFGTYDREIEDLLIAATGARRVVVFDRTRRSDGPDRAANPDGQRGPATRVHVDYPVKSGPQRARDILGGAEVDRILATGGSITEVNVWRPIKGPIQRSPLAWHRNGTGCRKCGGLKCC